MAINPYLNYMFVFNMVLSIILPLKTFSYFILFQKSTFVVSTMKLG